MPLLGLLGVKAVMNKIMNSGPSATGLKIIAGLSQTGISLTRIYSPVLPEGTETFFRTAENKYLSGVLIYDLKAQTDAAAARIIGGQSGTPEIFLSMEQKANDLLKQLDPKDGSRKTVAFGRELLPLAKWAMGFDRKKTLLLILQNSTEQRPTGGLIEELGIAVLEKGQLLDLTWFTPYDVETGLTGTEDSPGPIKAMLAEPGLLFRDANWSIDGPSAAVQLKKMYERSTGRGIDGMIFFSTPGLENILSKTTGSLREKSAFAGPEFPLQLAKDTFQAFKETPFSVVQGLIGALQNENVTIVPFETEQALLAAQLGIDGGIKKYLCPAQLYSSKCFLNFVYIVDADLGGKRLDYFLKKGRRIMVTLEPDYRISTGLELAYANTSTAGGSSTAYRGYTRVAVPLESVIQSVVQIKNDQTVQIMADNYIEFGQHIVGFPLEVLPGETALIKINYISTNKISIERGIGAYALNLKKQTGDSVETEIRIKLPEGVTPLSVYPRAGISDGSLIFGLTMEKSDQAVVEFAINDLFR